MRINKYLRDHGYASRREADELVENGEVFVNGTAAQMGAQVEETDTVEVRRKKEKKYIYRAYYKPRHLPTQSNEEGDVIALMKPRGLYPVGRLDKESEGLLIVTNDGRLTTSLLGADSETEKEYVVTVREPMEKNVPKIFAMGMNTEGLGQLLPANAELIDDNTLRVVLIEGKKHQIRVMLSELGYTTTQLKRVRIGPVTLGSLAPNTDRPLTKDELEILLV